MKIAILLYEGFTALDAIGPYEVLSRLPGAELAFVASRAGIVTSDTGFLGIEATAAVADVEAADLVLVPGGPGDVNVQRHTATLEWLRRIHERTTWTTSVCTGALILAAAGLLRGRRATTHWASLEVLREYGAEPVKARSVESGKIVTAAGVSAGIDMALRLAQRIVGDDFARAVQLGIEYDPDPPFDAGSPEKVAPEIVEMVRAFGAGGRAAGSRA
ncbi:MAG: DJ-1/PfpI family protein [Deltaproteobacteria bacterium]|nr:DJ-1/PfpI family protein [Deltaproteobacteria bacterium]